MKLRLVALPILAAGGFALTAIGMLVLLAAAVGVGVWEAAAGRPLLATATTRFAATVAAARQCLDLRSFLSLGGWLAQVSLIVATATALIVRLMRRHRRDDYRGRYRAWGWLAGLFMITACAVQVPLGALVSAFVSDATGITLGPGGMGWWVLTAGLLYAAVGLWAVLPLHERAATGIWLSTCLAAWTAAAACDWLVHSREMQPREWHLVVGNACWMAGAVLAAIAMLAAARSVLREVRGLPTRTTPRKDKATAPKETAGATTEDADRARHHREEREDDRPHPHHEAVVFTDTDEADADEAVEQSGRHLSKAERKRLKKLARMSRAA